jgi:predicted metal-dependent hydrolase
MERMITLKDRKINYKLRRSRRSKNLCLCVYVGGDFAVSAPRYITTGQIEDFILKKADWVIEKIDSMKKKGQDRLFYGSSQIQYRKLKNSAREIALQKIGEFNGYYGFSYSRISIRNQKTRWGSCSRNGTLNYNYKIALLPKKYADYIIVHELCHLGEFNHSRRFWDLVARTVPDYKDIRKELKKL